MYLHWHDSHWELQVIILNTRFNSLPTLALHGSVLHHHITVKYYTYVNITSLAYKTTYQVIAKQLLEHHLI